MYEKYVFISNYQQSTLTTLIGSGKACPLLEIAHNFREELPTYWVCWEVWFSSYKNKLNYNSQARSQIINEYNVQWWAEIFFSSGFARTQLAPPAPCVLGWRNEKGRGATCALRQSITLVTAPSRKVYLHLDSFKQRLQQRWRPILKFFASIGIFGHIKHHHQLQFSQRLITILYGDIKLFFIRYGAIHTNSLNYKGPHIINGCFRVIKREMSLPSYSRISQK